MYFIKCCCRKADRCIYCHIWCTSNCSAYTHRGQQLRQVLQRDEKEAGSAGQEGGEGKVEDPGGAGEEKVPYQYRRNKRVNPSVLISDLIHTIPK